MWEDDYLPTYDEAYNFFNKMRAEYRGWYELIREEHIYEILTREHVDALAKKLSSYKTVLEVGAGNGRLSHFLRERLPDASITAIDNGSWGIEPVFPVEKMEVEDAIDKHKPEAVISCWMLYSVDWTPLFRKCDSVKEYILIGETDGGCCGNEALWFGYDGEEPGYVQDGFVREDLEGFGKMQLCRSDFFDDYASWSHSSTVSFKRS